jgi:beta-glucoside PTS system EIICBA component
VRDAIVALPGWKAVGGEAVGLAPVSGKLIDRVFDFLSGTFQPLLYPLMGAAMVKLVLAIAVMIWPYDPTHMPTEVALLTAAGNALFFFLPIFVGITASKKLGANPYMGGVIAAALMEPNFTAMGKAGDVVQFFGAPLYLFSYANGMLAALLSSVALSYLERWLRKVTPKVIELVIVPMVCLLVLVPLSALVIGPFGILVGGALGSGLSWLSSTVPLLFYVLVGTGWVFMVMLGLHWALFPLAIVGLMSPEGSTLLGAAFAYQISIVGVGLGVFLKAKKDTQTRTLASGAFLASLLGGITEPTLYGLVLRYKRVLAAQLIGAFADSIVAGLFQISIHALVLSPLLSLPVFTPIIGYLITLVVGIGVAAAAVMVLGYADPKSAGKTDADADRSAVRPDAAALAAAGRTHQPQLVVSPAAGQVLPLSAVPDPIFAGGLLGPGVAIEPTSDRICSPMDGVVIVVPKSGHAVGIRNDAGQEVLVHVGLDTVKLNGDGFTVHVKNGDRVRSGDPLIDFDRSKITAAGYSLITPIVVSNAKATGGVTDLATGTIVEGGTLFSILPKTVAPRLAVLPAAVEIGLADHINASLNRLDQGIPLHNSMLWETRASYPDEFAVALEVLDLVESGTGKRLPIDEVGFITMHLVSNAVMSRTGQSYQIALTLRDIEAIIEADTGVAPDGSSAAYVRFLTHLKFVLQRLTERTQFSGNFDQMFTAQKTADPQGWACARRIADFLESRYQTVISDEETLYLMIHLARLRMKPVPTPAPIPAGDADA